MWFPPFAHIKGLHKFMKVKKCCVLGGRQLYFYTDDYTQISGCFGILLNTDVKRGVYVRAAPCLAYMACS